MRSEGFSINSGGIKTGGLGMRRVRVTLQPRECYENGAPVGESFWRRFLDGCMKCQIRVRDVCCVQCFVAV